MDDRERFVRGTLAGTFATIAVGLIGFGLLGMWNWALGFTAGALVSLVSFQLIVASVARFMDQPSSRTRDKRSWWISSLVRLLGTVALLFVAIRYLPIHPIGLALGLLAVQIGMGGYVLMRSLTPSGETVGMEDRKP